MCWLGEERWRNPNRSWEIYRHCNEARWSWISMESLDGRHINTSELCIGVFVYLFLIQPTKMKAKSCSWFLALLHYIKSLSDQLGWRESLFSIGSLCIDCVGYNLYFVFLLLLCLKSLLSWVIVQLVVHLLIIWFIPMQVVWRVLKRKAR